MLFTNGTPHENHVRTSALAAADHFAAAVLHDINNPLEAATNLAYLIRQEDDCPAKIHRYTRLLEEQLFNISSIARQALGFYRQPKRDLDLVTIAEAALRVHEKKLSEKGVRLRRALPDEAMVCAHPGEMLQLISNLLGNAIDALPTEGVLSVRIRKCAKDVCVTIVDNGHGIPDIAAKRVFEPFFSTKGEKGTGLGLAISRSIVDHHNGRMRMRSSTRPGRSGTMFRITLPQAPTTSLEHTL